MWTYARIISSQQSLQLSYNIDSFGCQSCSTVYRNYTDTGQTVVGNHAYGTSSSYNYNRGTRITQSVYAIIYGWKNR